MSTEKTAINKRDKVCPLKDSVFWTAEKSMLSVMLSIINIIRTNLEVESVRIGVVGMIEWRILFYIGYHHTHLR